MCLNKRKIRNPYTGRHLYVDCGKCEACQQKRANANANKIRLHHEALSDKYVPLFIHLTYCNECVPYILRSDLFRVLGDPGCDHLPVYRDFERRLSRRSTGRRRRKYAMVFHHHDPYIGDLGLANEKGKSYLPDEFDIDGIPDLEDTFHPRMTTRSMAGKIGVCWTPDIQNFFKKLERYANRNGLPCDYSYYWCYEYGGEKLRPHWHVLLWCRRGHEAAFKTAVLASWSYAFRYVTERRLEVAVDPAGYVASYVNKSHDFPSLLASHPFRQRSSKSRGFATHLREFSLDKILEKVRDGDLTYIRRVFSNGSPVDISSPYPSFVIRWYFPLYKGFSRFTNSEILELGRYSSRFSGEGLRQYPQEDFYRQLEQLYFHKHPLQATVDNSIYDSLIDECRAIWNKAASLNMSLQEYLEWYVRTWTCQKSTLLKYSWRNRDLYDSWFAYDNIEDYFTGDVRNDSLDDLLSQMSYDFTYVLDPNDFPQNVAEHERLISTFQRHQLKHGVNKVFYKIEN